MYNCGLDIKSWPQLPTHQFRAAPLDGVLQGPEVCVGVD